MIEKGHYCTKVIEKGHYCTKMIKKGHCCTKMIKKNIAVQKKRLKKDIAKQND
jgi:hypothetical protein